ncbi:MAG: S41 family peptidase, partial [Kiloniellales bacterium]
MAQAARKKTRAKTGAARKADKAAVARRKGRADVKRIEAKAVEAIREQRAVADAAIAATELGAVQSLPDFLATTGMLTLAERERTVVQALVLLDDLYVHLPLKEAMHAINPLQRLRLLRWRLPSLTERQFHNEMIGIFVRLRDLHTNYILPAPYNQHTAFLPFLLEEYYDDDRTRHYVVSRLIAGFSHPTFQPGVEVTSWNGIPINRAVEINADREAGSNEDARHVRGLDNMTVRPMMMSLPPDEEWVIVGYRDDATEREIRLDWRVFAPDPAPSGAVSSNAKDPLARAVGIDLLIEARNRARKLLFAREAMAQERRVARLAERQALRADLLGTEAASSSILPDVFSSFGAVDTDHGEFGYIRIRSFNADPNVFIPELIRILGLVPQNGLIIDVRGNGGGVILCGERMLQLLTPKRIQAEPLHFINTPLTETLVSKQSWLKPWEPSVKESVTTGAIFSQGFPIEPEENSNQLGQHYVGPVVVITDARCYSTTDIFAAGFQDHGIGTILGADGNTGAGGANVWTHDLLRQLLPGTGSPIKPLPNGADMRVAIRRTTRVGPQSGRPLEDLGVVPDERHLMTRNDLLNGNVDLINRAAEVLADEPRRALSATATRQPGNKAQLVITSEGLDRVDVYAANGRPL